MCERFFFIFRQKKENIDDSRILHDFFKAICAVNNDETNSKFWNE